MIDRHHGWNASYKPVVLGFVFSLVLLLASYLILTYHHLFNHALYVTLIALGCSQVLLQLVFFLHLGLESKPRWNLLMFLFAFGLIFILVGGSMWIMAHLNYNMMPQMGGQ